MIPLKAFVSSKGTHVPATPAVAGHPAHGRPGSAPVHHHHRPRCRWPGRSAWHCLAAVPYQAHETTALAPPNSARPKTVSAKPAAILPAGHLAHQVGWEKAPPSFGAALSLGRWIADPGRPPRAGGRPRRGHPAGRRADAVPATCPTPRPARRRGRRARRRARRRRCSATAQGRRPRRAGHVRSRSRERRAAPRARSRGPGGVPVTTRPGQRPPPTPAAGPAGQRAAEPGRTAPARAAGRPPAATGPRRRAPARPRRRPRQPRPRTPRAPGPAVRPRATAASAAHSARNCARVTGRPGSASRSSNSSAPPGSASSSASEVRTPSARATAGSAGRAASSYRPASSGSASATRRSAGRWPPRTGWRRSHQAV